MTYFLLSLIAVCFVRVGFKLSYLNMPESGNDGWGVVISMLFDLGLSGWAVYELTKRLA